MGFFKFLFLSVLLVGFHVGVGATTYLVAVGVSDYPGTERDLRLPANDAATMQYVSSKNSNAVSVLLTNSNATKANVISRLRSTFSKAKEGDVIIFFFSGHGSPGAFSLYDARVSYAEIRKVMAQSKARNKLVFADACFSGKMRQGRAGKAAQAFSKYNIVLFLSSRSNETSIERPTMKNGFFTACLYRGLRGGADANRDRAITAKELFDYVSRGVKRLSGDRQHPVMWGRFSDDMVIMKW